MRAAVKIVAVVGVVEVHVIVFIPQRRPVLRPGIDESHPITVVLEARESADKNHREVIDAEEVVAPKIAMETGVRNAIAVITTALRPRVVFVIPRGGARLHESTANLPLMLGNAALVNSTVGWAIALDVAVIDATVALLRGPGGSGGAGLLSRASRMSCWSWVASLLITLVLMLCEDGSSGSELKARRLHAYSIPAVVINHNVHPLR